MQSIDDFWMLTVDVWNNGVLGVDIGKILVAVGIFLGFLLIRGLLTHYLLRWLMAIAKRTKTTADDEIIQLIEQPVRFIPIAMGFFFAVEFLGFEGIYQQVAHNVVRSMIAFAIFWALLRALGPLSRLFSKLESIFTAELVEWIVKALRIAVVLVGAATVLQIWGIQVGPIIAGAGLVGVAVALGAQDLFKNLIAGLLILGEKRFRNGDWIKVDGVVEGTVEAIGFRSTMVRQFDKAPVMVPNARLSDTAVVNYSGMTHRRIYWMIGVEYRTTVPQLRKIRDEIEAYITENDDIAPVEEASSFVRIDKFNDSSIDIMLYCFTKTVKWAEWLEIKEALAYKIIEIVEGAGTGFAFPSTSVYVESLPSGTPEAFQPPVAADAAATKSET